MKTIILSFITCLTIIACSENQLDLQGSNNEKVSARSASTIVYFYDNLGEGLTYDSQTGEHEVTIDNDFELRPYGESWIPYSSPLRIKIKCKCSDVFNEGGYCDPLVEGSGPITVDCVDPCEEGCKMKVKIRSLGGIPIDEFDSGGEFRLQ